MDVFDRNKGLFSLMLEAVCTTYYTTIKQVIAFVERRVFFPSY